MNERLHILLVDDDAQVRKLAGDLLRQEFPRAEVHAVGDPDGLRHALDAGGFCLVVTDYRLGWTDGLQVLRTVKHRYPDCPVIMFTATGSEEIAVEAMKSGLDDYVLKSPEHIGRLAVSVRMTLEQAAQRRTLKETEAQYRTLVHDVLDTSDVGVFILDAQFHVVRVNAAVERAFALRREDVLGRDNRALIQEHIKHLFDRPDEFAAQVLRTYERNENSAAFDCHMPARDGRAERWFEHRSLPILTGLYAGGRIEHYYDITERKRAETTARQHESNLTALVDSAMDAIVVVDGEHRVLLLNRAAETMFRCAAADVVGRPLDRFIPERFRAGHRDYINRYGETGRTNRVMGRLGIVYGLRADGTEIPLEIALSKGTSDGRVFYTAIMRDVTERKQMERHAGRIERLAALGQLLGGIAHEIKNPLFVLTGRLQLLKEKAAVRDYDTVPSDLEKIEEAAKRMTHVTERFLTLAKPSLFRQVRCDIRTILGETLDFLSNELTKSQIRLVAELPPGLPAVRSDQGQLQEAFLNLILNAIQAMTVAHGRGTLTVTAAQVADPLPPVAPSLPEGRWIEVRIRDDGPGILPEHRSRLFEPFFSTKPANEGTGLGLWTVRTIVMGMKGRVTFETEVGRGTTFVVLLPAAEDVKD